MDQDIRFTVFGSENSRDVDILVYIEKPIDKPHLAGNLAHDYESKLQHLFPNRELDCNLGIIRDNVLVWVYKGNVDETNNAVLATHHLHKQNMLCPITKRVQRDVKLKVVKFTRVVCAVFSKSSRRADVKVALKGNVRTRYNFLITLDISVLAELNIDKLKTLAFQIAQMSCLINNVEIYTKSQINCDLIDFVMRKPSDLRILHNRLRAVLQQISNLADDALWNRTG